MNLVKPDALCAILFADHGSVNTQTWLDHLKHGVVLNGAELN